MLDKAIEHNKEHRKQYRGAKSIDRTCRPHGSCPYCQESRAHRSKKLEYDAKEQIDEVLNS